MLTGLRNPKGEGLQTAQERSYALIIIAACLVMGVLYLARAVFITSLVALIVAFLLDPFVGLLTRAKFPRPLATFLVCAFAVMMIYLAGLLLWNELSGIARVAPDFRNNLTAKIAAATNRFQEVGDSAARILGAGQPGVTGSTGARPGTGGTSHLLPKTGKKTITVDAISTPTGAIPEVRIHDDRNPISTYVVASLGTLYQFVLM